VSRLDAIKPPQGVEAGAVGGEVGELGILNDDPIKIDGEVAERGSSGLEGGDGPGVVVWADFAMMAFRLATEAVRGADGGPVAQTGSSVKRPGEVLWTVYDAIQQVSAVLGLGERVSTVALTVGLGGGSRRLAGLEPAAGFTGLGRGTFAAGPRHRAIPRVSLWLATRPFRR
jgi:hypothetical protein